MVVSIWPNSDLRKVTSLLLLYAEDPVKSFVWVGVRQVGFKPRRKLLSFLAALSAVAGSLSAEERFVWWWKVLIFFCAGKKKKRQKKRDWLHK